MQIFYWFGWSVDGGTVMETSAGCWYIWRSFVVSLKQSLRETCEELSKQQTTSNTRKSTAWQISMSLSGAKANPILYKLSFEQKNTSWFLMREGELLHRTTSKTLLPSETKVPFDPCAVQSIFKGGRGMCCGKSQLHPADVLKQNLTENSPLPIEPPPF